MSRDPSPLRTTHGPLAGALQAAADDTHGVASQLRERVWRRLAAPPRRRRAGWWPVAAAAGALAAFAAVAIWTRHVPKPAAPEGAVAVVEASLPLVAANRDLVPAGATLRPGARAEVPAGGFAVLQSKGVRAALAPRTLFHVERDGLHLDAGAGAFRVLALTRVAVGSARVDASSGVFAAETRGESVTITAREGSLRVYVSGKAQAVAAGSTWSSDRAAAASPEATAPIGRAAALEELLGRASPAPTAAKASNARLLARLTTATEEAPRDDLRGRARARESTGDLEGAAALFAETATGDDPGAATALYELARLRSRLGQFAGTVAATDEYRQRFPTGALAQEAALTGIEARVSLGQSTAALESIDDFLQRYATSERALEVRWLRASLQVQRGACREAEADLRALSVDARHGDDAAFALAGCAPPGSSRIEALRDYLRRYPSGRNQVAARDALDRAEQ